MSKRDKRKMSFAAAFKELGFSAERKYAKRRESLRVFTFGSGSTDSNESRDTEVSYRVAVLGGKKTGKTAIISQFLYDQYPPVYRETIEEMYRGDFEIDGNTISIKIQDTGGSYVYDFPSMVGVSLYSANATIIVFSVDNLESFEEAARLRDLVMSVKGPDTPIVIVGNKTDLDRVVSKDETEATVVFDWENGYVECSAKLNLNIQDIFREVLSQAKNNLADQSALKTVAEVGSNSSSRSSTPVSMTRRKSLPQVPAYTRRPLKEEISPSSLQLNKINTKKNKKKNLFVSDEKNSCKTS